MCGYAQTDNEHLKFKGVPIDGTLKQYVQKMESAGFVYVGQQEGIALLQGDFAGYKGCTVGVATLTGKDLVNKITVIFPKNDTWSTLYGTYSNLKSMLTEKFGEPSSCVEEFQGYTEPRDDNNRMHNVQMDRCNYVTTFSPNTGDIQLFISHDSVISCFVILSYYDKTNSDIIRQKAIDDL